jgi:hypothetical protein
VTAADASSVRAKANCTADHVFLRLRSSVHPRRTTLLRNTSVCEVPDREFRFADITSVWIVRVAVATAVPLGVTEVGLTTQVALAGAPVHARLTAWLNPAMGVTERVAVAVLPAVTVALAGKMDRVKPGATAVVIVSESAVDVEAEKLAAPPYAAVIE